MLITRRTWGSTGKEVERSTFWIEGKAILFSSQVILFTFLAAFDSSSHLASFQTLIYHMLPVHCDDGHFHNKRSTIRMANTWIPVGLDYSALACGWLSHSTPGTCLHVVVFAIAPLSSLRENALHGGVCTHLP
jgi:hypothetical protein